MYVSFDIFDTCLIRRCGSPDNVFFLLGQRLFGVDTTLANMFYNWRVGAEKEAKKLYNKSVVSIEDIYTTIRSELQSKYSIDELVDAEKNIESDLLCALPATLDIISELRTKGTDIVFISDMYLPSELLSEILQREGISMKTDDIFVSCECGCTKSTGELYSYVSKIRGELPQKHYGDNLWSDIKKAREVGINSVQIDSSFSKTEIFLLEQTKNIRQCLVISCLVGALRHSRLTSGFGKFSGFSSDFVVPVWTAYVLACLRKASKDGLDRLYFLARDGYILHYIAKQYTSIFFNIECRYLYVSRKSMYLPSLSSTKECDIEKYFADNFQFVNQEIINQYFKTTSWVEDEVLENAQQARNRINEYFDKEGIYDSSSKYALVDIGWKGSGRYAFNRLMRLHNSPEREMWYWGTFKEWRNKYSGNYWTYNANQKLPLFFITLMEDYFSASPDMSTIDYTHGTPVFDINSEIDNSKILEANIAGIDRFTKFIIDFHLEGQESLDIISSLSCSVLTDHPEYIDIDVFSQMKCFSERGIDTHFVKKVNFFYVVKYVIGMSGLKGWSDGNLVYSYPRYYKMFNHIRSFSLLLRRRFGIFNK